MGSKEVRAREGSLKRALVGWRGARDHLSGSTVWIFQGIFRDFPKVQSGDGHSEGAEGGLSTFGAQEVSPKKPPASRWQRKTLKFS